MHSFFHAAMSIRGPYSLLRGQGAVIVKHALVSGPVSSRELAAKICAVEHERELAITAILARAAVTTTEITFKAIERKAAQPVEVWDGLYTDEHLRWRRLLWSIDAFDEEALIGVVSYPDGRQLAFGSTSFSSNSSQRWPQVGEHVEVVFNGAGALLHVHAQ